MQEVHSLGHLVRMARQLQVLVHLGKASKCSRQLSHACSPCTRGPCSQTTPAERHSACSRHTRSGEGMQAVAWMTQPCDIPGR